MSNSFIQFVNKSKNAVGKQSPLILSILALFGLGATVYLAVKATPKSLNELELEKEVIGDEIGEMPENVRLTKKEVVKVVWKNYIPAAISGVATAGCILGSHTISSRRIGSLANLYSITSAAFTEYKQKVVEKIGESTTRKIHDEIMDDKVNQHDISEENPILITGDGDHLCYDPYSDTLYKSNIEKHRKIENDLNHKIIVKYESVSLNDLRYELNLPPIKYGYSIGWNSLHPIEFAFSSTIKNGTPVLVVDFVVGPYYDYEKL